MKPRYRRIGPCYQPSRHHSKCRCAEGMHVVYPECKHDGECNRAPYPTCLCGARMDTPATHPHVAWCPCSQPPVV